jgi:DNA invertase Pin-like site-specific DNA recombinase
MKLLDTPRKGDVVIVWKLDRLARSLRQLIDTATPSGKLTFHTFAALAELSATSCVNG